MLSRQGSAGTTGLVVKDPSTGRYFRFGEIEAFLLQSLDGTVPLETIRSRVEERFEAPLSRTALEGFVGRLRSLGLIEERSKVPTGPPRGRLRGDPLYLRFKVFDPDRLLDWMAGRLGFLFTTPFVVLSAIGIAAAIAVSIANQAEIAQAVRGLYNLRSLLTAWVTVYVVMVVHEFAHGLTCKRFGGSVREIGFFLIFFQPAFYCNVSDAWLFPKKSHRIWVTFAGAYAEIFLWALAILVWRVTEPGTVTSQTALVVMATSAIKTLINLNPLIKLDGYYLLSDALEIPNLRQKAMAYLRGWIGRLTGGRTPNGPPTPRREARIFLVYGLVAGTYSVWLLGYVGLWFGGLLVARYQGWGAVLFAILFLAVFRAPISRSLDSLRAMSRTGQALRASLMRGMKIFAVVTPALAVLWLGKMELKVAGDFNVLPAHNADVRSDVEGIIQEIRVKEGDHVERGDVISVLSDRDYRAEIGQVGAQIEESQARLQMLKEGPRAEEVSLALTSIEKAQERLRYAREKRQMLNTLFAQNLVSQKEFAEAEEDVSVRQKELEEAEGRLKMLRAGSRPGEIESVAAETRRWEAHRRYLEDKLMRISIVSPISGVITTPKLEQRVGELVHQGDLIAKVHDLSTVTAEIAVSEYEISDVQVGQKVELRARSYPGRSFHGTVTSIAPTFSRGLEPSAGKSIVVTTRLDNPSLLLKPEMTGTAKIHCGQTRVLSLLTRRLSHTLRLEFWSWW
ncbi:MAG TPA: efflux RND transporter periplasmic adaptor subunit [Candidatus Polarisedimenticolia bacterium]|nr:efflux RND transporter periplasmic adaptor subunit [Candidatus Polarisedimenticolia bacterium]